jgi:hypothetical protein
VQAVEGRSVQESLQAVEGRSVQESLQAVEGCSVQESLQAVTAKRAAELAFELGLHATAKAAVDCFFNSPAAKAAFDAGQATGTITVSPSEKVRGIGRRTWLAVHAGACTCNWRAACRAVCDSTKYRSLCRRCKGALSKAAPTNCLCMRSSQLEWGRKWTKLRMWCMPPALRLLRFPRSRGPTKGHSRARRRAQPSMQRGQRCVTFFSIGRCL